MRGSTIVIFLVVIELIGLGLVYSDSLEKRSVKEGDLMVVLEHLKGLGISELAIATDCYSTRNPGTVDASGCFRDLPAGMCYHASCSGYGTPSFDELKKPMVVEHV